MSGKYRYNHRSVKHHHYALIAIVAVLLILAGIVSLIIFDLKHHDSGSVEGQSKIIGQVIGDNATKKDINEQTFTMQLPTDWKELSRVNSSTEQSITWIGTRKENAGRTFKVYVDAIPLDLPVNRSLPVSANGRGINTSDVSENCATFTQGGTLDTQQAMHLKPTPARWQGVDFICNLPNVVENKIGTSSHDGINRIDISGPEKGKHKYFFLFTDQTIQPDYSVLMDALASFQAK